MRSVCYLAVLLCTVLFAGCSKDDGNEEEGDGKTYVKGSFGGTAFNFTDIGASYVGGFLFAGGQFDHYPDSLRFSVEVNAPSLDAVAPMGDTYNENRAFIQVGTTTYTTYYSQYVDCTGGVSVDKYSAGGLKLHRDGDYITGEYSGTLYNYTSCLINDTKPFSVQFRIKLDE